MSGADAAFRVRHSTAEDEPFLRDVFAATRPAPLNIPAFRPLAEMQYDARQRTYAQHSAEPALVIEADGRPAGTLWLWRSDVEIRIADIAVAPEFQRRGFGKAAIQYAIQEAEARALPLRLTAERGNAAALRLYRALGFHVTAESETDFSLEFTPLRTPACGRTE